MTQQILRAVTQKVLSVKQFTFASLTLTLFVACLHLNTCPGFSTTKTSRKKISDPAPPKIYNLQPTVPPTPKVHPEVTLHRAPASLLPDAISHDWESFLGPTHNAISSETKLIKSWSANGPPLIWEMNSGSGYSSPAISKGYLVYLHRLENREVVECLEPETGRSFWQFLYPTDYKDRYGYSNGPRATPVIADGRVYTYGANGQLHCLKLDTGQLYWKRDLLREFGVPQDFFGATSTPLIEGNHLIVTLGTPDGPTVVALEKDTGKLVWGAGTQWGPSYASPIAATIHGKRRVFVFAGGESRPPTGGLIVLDPEDGSIDFTFPWRSRSYESVNASSPVVIDDSVFLSASYRTGSVLLRISSNFTPSVVWKTKEVGLHWNTAVHKDGHLYAYDGRNEPDASIVCLDLKTGKILWRTTPEWDEIVTYRGTQRTLNVGTLRGSLLWADGSFVALGELGHLLRLELTPTGYKEIARSWLFSARQTWNLPVLSHGLLYITQNEYSLFDRKPPRLLCYDLRSQQ